MQRGAGHRVSGLDGDDFLVLRRGADQVEERALDRLERRFEVVASADDQRRQLDARRVIAHRQFGRRVLEEARALQHAGFEARFQGVYEPGPAHFYFSDHDGIEYEIVSYTSST